jgi:hypothetical protein
MKKKLFIYLIGLVSFGMLKAQYCITNLGGFCGSAEISNFSISGTSLNNSSGCSTGVGGQAYSYYAPSANTSTTLIKGQQYTLNITTANGSPTDVKVYIDFNKDLDWLDAGEEIIVCSNCIFSSVYSVTFTVPTSAVTDTTRLRVRTRQFTIADACENMGSGETEDYLVYLDPGVPCTGTPVVGTTQASDTAACLGQLVTFSMNGLVPAGDLTFQWQINGVNSPNDTNSFLVDTVSGPDTYQCVVTCTNSGQTATSAPLSITVNPFQNCYCNISNANTFGTDIGNVTVGSFTNGTASPIISNPNAVNTYTNFTSLPPIALLSGVPNQIQFTGITSSGFVGFTTLEGKVFIDYNHDGIFDPVTELAISGTGDYNASNSSVISGSPLIPSSALTGLTGMRIMLYEGFFPDACNTFGNNGETEDYIVDIQPAPACTGTPNAGITTTSDSVICPNSLVTLDLQGSGFAFGISYQWQSSSSLSGPYSNITNATNISYPTDSVTAASYFQCVLTCATSGLSSPSSPVFVDIKPFTQCYCNTNLGGSCSPNANNVTLNTLSNPSTLCNNAGGQAYTIFPDTGSLTTTLIKGVTYPFSLNVGFGPAYQITAFIDYNRDGIYNNTNERIDVLPYNFNNTQTSFTIPVTIPLTADTSYTGFRIRIRASSFNDACDPLGSGETEDYTIRIIDGTPCSGTPNAGSVVTPDSSVCLGSIVNFSLSGSSQLAGLTYQWQENGVNIVGATNSILSDTITGPSTYQCIVTCTNSSSSATSTAVTLTINPFSQCYCPIISSSTFGTDIGNVTVGGFSNGSAVPITGNNNATNTYTDYTGLAPIPLLSSIPNNIQMTGITSSTFVGFTTLNGSVYIDYNQDGTYDPITELAFSGTGNYTAVNGSVISGNPMIPSSALSGVTGMRVMLYEGSFANACNPPSFTGGETEDYLVDIQPAVSCSGTPIAGSSQSTDTLVCVNDLFTLSLNGAVLGSGLSYQWYANGVLIPGDTLPIVSNTSQSANTIYTCVVTCAISSLSATSTGVSVNMDTPVNCACIPSFVNGCSGDEIISVSINGTVNNTGTSCPISPYYTSFTTPVMSANPGDTTICVFEHGNVYQHYINVWIDYNDDFTFSDNERVITNLDMPDSVIQVSTYFIATNDTNVHKVRVLQNYNTAVANPQSCGTTYSYGETEDYLINISDTVTTVLSLGKPLSKSRVFNVKLFPNPTTGVLNYEIPANIKQANITVSDLLGRTLVSRTANKSKSIDLSELKNGTYSVSISLDGKVFQSKVVLNK